MTILAEKKQLVAPGELLAEGSYFPGENTYREGSRVFASRIGLADLVANKLIVVPLKGCYVPRVDDFVIGRVVDIAMSGWTVDISAPYPAMLPLSETPAARGMASRKDLTLVFNIGDLVMAEVIAFDRTRDPLLTVRGRGLGKVSSGRVVNISPAKIPRLIGRKGSMISMLKKATGCDIIVGQNGTVLVSGRQPKNEQIAVAAMFMIEREAHTRGLTDRVSEMMNRELR
ncbi:exosome complex RNA-binding protein Rrp4 [[Eubacterium] cellulosolvens]